MRYVIGLAIGLLVAGQVSAATLEWDRNTEPDMKDYAVWACFTPSCVVIKSATTLQPGLVSQTVSGVKPTYQLAIEGKEGAVAVSARDQSLNESGLSVPLPFDARAPQTPAGLILK